jgi:hypothetical protein
MPMQVHNSKNQELFIGDREEDAIRKSAEHRASRFFVDGKLKRIRFYSFQEIVPIT